MPAVTVECDRQTYAIPQVSLLELVAWTSTRRTAASSTCDGAGVPFARRTAALVDLREVFGRPARDGTRATIAVLQADTVRFGLMVDRVLNTEEIVVKPLSARSRRSASTPARPCSETAGWRSSWTSWVARRSLTWRARAGPPERRTTPLPSRSRSSRCWSRGSATAAGWRSRWPPSPGWSDAGERARAVAAREVMQYRGRSLRWSTRPGAGRCPTRATSSRGGLRRGDRAVAIVATRSSTLSRPPTSRASRGTGCSARPSSG